MTTHFDSIIIGAGLGGLTAAAKLAQSGRAVLLLERNTTLGGRARTDDLDGWLFNQGGHALYRSGIGHRTLQAVGVDPVGEIPPLEGAQFLVGNRTTALPLGPRQLAMTKALSARGKMQFARLLTTLPKLDPTAFADVTVDEWLRDFRPDVQAAVRALVRLSTYAAATDIMSADAAIIQLRDGSEGVLYLHDGWAALVAQLAGVAERAGATITTGAPVDTIEHRSGGFRVRSGDQSFTSATVIVAAGGPSLSARMLGLGEDAFGPVGPAPEAAVLDLALDAMPAHHRFVLGIDEPTFFSVHSPPARLAPEAAVAAVAMRYLAPGDGASADEHRASLERIAAAAGCPTPVRSRFLRRMTVTNGLPIAAAGGMQGRPPVAVSQVDGAFIAGDWVGHRGVLADAAIASGHDAAEAASRTIGALALAH